MVNKKTASKPVILITGKDGQVGWELQRSVAHIGNVVACDSKQLDLSNVDSIVKVLRDVKPNIIINPAAYTAVDKAEEEPELAMKVNGVGPQVLAEEGLKLNALLMHYSTDYVFDGTKASPYSEIDLPCPLNVYGKTKLHGEKMIQDSGVRHLIFRTSWVYASRGHNFVHSILRLAKKRESLNVIEDQTGSPTWARLISEVSMHALISSLSDINSGSFESGLYNLVSSGKTSWFGFAKKIIDYAQCKLDCDGIIVKNIYPIPASEYPAPAKRPKNSCLDTSKLEERFNLYLPSWEQSLELCMMELR